MSIQDEVANLTAARRALQDRHPDQAALVAGAILESLLRTLLQGNLQRFPRTVQKESEVVLAADRTLARASFGNLVKLFRDPGVFRSLEEATGPEIRDLMLVDLAKCVEFRNSAAHRRRSLRPGQARYVIDTATQFLGFMGADVDGPHCMEPEAAPLVFDDRNDLLRSLLRRVWLFPQARGVRDSWAVKESTVLTGDVEAAVNRPGLGIALFTTELALDVFGASARRPLQRCVVWGAGQTLEEAPHFIWTEEKKTATGVTEIKPDLRHTVALAILMTRLASHEAHRAGYLDWLLDHVGPDGGWPAYAGETESDLPATAYVVEFLAACQRLPPGLRAQGNILSKALHRGQQWLVDRVLRTGGWSMTSFKDKPWNPLWSTAYILMRLIAANPPEFSLWSCTLQAAAAAVLRDAAGVQIADPDLRMRVEARAAACLSRSLEVNVLADPIVRERAETWLSRWEDRLMAALRSVPVSKCDLATASFAAAALLRTVERKADLGVSVIAAIRGASTCGIR